MTNGIDTIKSYNNDGWYFEFNEDYKETLSNNKNYDFNIITIQGLEINTIPKKQSFYDK